MNEGLDDLTYSSEAQASRFLLFQGLNEINLIVEDIDREYIYETIFKRMLGDQYNISAIFAIGGKPAVIERYKEFKSETDGIKNFYIVDGDFDRYIYSDEMIDNECFIYLKTYNIESYFSDEEACVQFIKGRMKCLDEDVKKKLNFYYWKNRIVSEASSLFLNYCFVKKYYPQKETLSRSHYLFIDYKTGFERTDENYQKFEKEVAALDPNSEDKIAEIDTIYKSINGNDYFNLICGKFLFDSLCCYIRKIIDDKFNKEDFKWHLINHFDISKLDYVKNIILGHT